MVVTFGTVNPCEQLSSPAHQCLFGIFGGHGQLPKLSYGLGLEHCRYTDMG